MLKRYISKLSCVLSAFALAACAHGAYAAPAAAQSAQSSECTGLKIATGPSGKGYSKLFSDVNRACGAQINLCEVPSEGGLDNLDKLSANEADLGMSQLDNISYRKTGDENIAALQAVMPLNLNYLHIIVSTTGFTVESGRKWYGSKDAKNVVVQRFSDLRGQRVAVVGSSALMVRKLDRDLALGIVFVDVVTDSEAFAMVKNGGVAAATTISGWPSGTVNALKQADNLTLVPFDSAINAPYLVKPISYRGLGTYNVNSLAVPNLLVTRPFKGDKSNDVTRLKSCIISNLANFQEGSAQPGWKEVKDVNNTYDVPKFQAGVSATANARVMSTTRK